MPLKRLKYTTLDELIKDNLSVEEDVATKELIKCLKNTKQRGWLLKEELIKICYWKSARAIRLIESNHPQTIKKITQSALGSKDEALKILELKKLKGVGIPMASAILMLTNPNNYGVIDIRVWEVLYKIGTVKTKPKGANLHFKEWELYVDIINRLSKNHRVSARAIERTLFKVHQENQDGNLYQYL